MAVKSGKAKTFDREELLALLEEVRDMNHGAHLRVAIMLSAYAGLRVQEICGVQWDVHIFKTPGVFHTREFVRYMDGNPVRDGTGRVITDVVPVIEVFDDISKYTGGRALPIHPDLQKALTELWQEFPESIWVIPARQEGASESIKLRAHSLKMWMNRTYKKLGMKGYSTHSGRRSFGTRSAQTANATECSLRDTQVLLGHASIATTQEYVDTSARVAHHVGGIW